MKNIIIFLLFILYSTVVFFINSHFILGGLFIFHVLLIIILRINIVKAIVNILKIGIFILIAAITNYIILNLEEAVLVSVKLILVCNMTYIFSRKFKTKDLAEVIEKLCYPLKLFKINPKDVGLVVSIAIAFIPILREEVTQTTFALKAKGVKINLKNGSLILRPIFIGIFKRVNELEFALRAKGYN